MPRRYNTYVAHYKEADCASLALVTVSPDFMSNLYPLLEKPIDADTTLRCPAGFRQIYEPLWLQYGVDLLFSGHVHAYERSNPVANCSADPSGCAPMQLIVGDGGNHEGVRGCVGLVA